VRVERALLAPGVAPRTRTGRVDRVVGVPASPRERALPPAEARPLERRLPRVLRQHGVVPVEAIALDGLLLALRQLAAGARLVAPAEDAGVAQTPVAAAPGDGRVAGHAHREAGLRGVEPAAPEARQQSPRRLGVEVVRHGVGRVARDEATAGRERVAEDAEQLEVRPAAEQVAEHAVPEHRADGAREVGDQGGQMAPARASHRLARAAGGGQPVAVERDGLGARVHGEHRREAAGRQGAELGRHAQDHGGAVAVQARERAISSRMARAVGSGIGGSASCA